jgi:hypothetical protein
MQVTYNTAAIYDAQVVQSETLADADLRVTAILEVAGVLLSSLMLHARGA